MDIAAQERLEASADSTGVSSLVAPIGGLATYPSMVLDEDTPEHVLAAVAHEWVHQYLVFYPLGAGYWNSQETREINGRKLATTAELAAATSWVPWKNARATVFSTGRRFISPLGPKA